MQPILFSKLLLNSAQQAAFEFRANNQFNQILRNSGLLTPVHDNLDAWFGPRLFKNETELLDLFMRKYAYTSKDRALDKIVDPEKWPNAIFIPLVAALHEKKRVSSVPVEYRHPSEQTSIETNNPAYQRLRAVQYRGIITSLIHYLRLLHADPHKPSNLNLVG